MNTGQNFGQILANNFNKIYEFSRKMISDENSDNINQFLRNVPLAKLKKFLTKDISIFGDNKIKTDNLKKIIV